MIKDHGKWIRYTPAVEKPELAGRCISYAKRDGPGFGQDWYDYIASKPFGANSVVMTVEQTADGDVVQSSTRDPSEIFPAGMQVIEETEYIGESAFTDFSGRMYNADLRKIGGKRVIPPSRVEKLESVVEALMKRIAELEGK